MPRPRFSKLASEKQDHILDVAEKAFIDKGFSGASQNEIMKELKLSKGAFYYYFDDKADLFSTCFTRIFVSFGPGFENLKIDYASDKSFWESLFDACHAMQKSAIEHPKWPAMMRLMNILSTDPKLAGEFEKLSHFWDAWAKEVLSRGQEKGYIRQDLDIGLVTELWLKTGRAYDTWIFSQYTTDNIDELNEETVRAFAETFLDLSQRMFSPKISRQSPVES